MWVEKIKSLAKQNELKISEVAVRIGMSESNLYKCFNRGSIEVKHLETIAHLFKVPVAAFFDTKDYPANKQSTAQFKEGANAYGKAEEKNKEILQKEIARLNKELNTCQTKLINLLEKKSK